MPALIVLALVLWLMLALPAAAQDFAALAAEAQRAFQAQLAGLLRSLHQGEPGALAALWGMCLFYNVAHAIGPGHGKFLIGAYGAGVQVPMRRLVGVGLTASLAQAGMAVFLVYGGVLIFNASRAGLQDLADTWLDRASLLAIAAIGAWLMARGILRLRPAAGPAPGMAAGPHHHHEHAHDTCPSCGHAHAPDPKALAHARNWQEVAAMVGAIAIRPCTGALFLLILTWRMGLVWQGIIGAFVMGLGTGMVSMAVAVLAVGARQGAGALGGRWLARLRAAAPLLEVGAGALIVLVAMQMLRLV
jgi:nickel/cobalt exporter